ncbi:MAG: AI-2E family transporter [Desulfobulbaceae bacterium]|nr:AI-2E family transporter [Desulfobulbaceae bacterium]HIJ90547.1 AI-2E family transporter [Deltaproteobacteria bacterium]
MDQEETVVRSYGPQEVAAWLVIVVLVTLIVKTLSFIFIPLSVAVLVFFAVGMPMEFLRRFGVPGWLRILLVVSFILDGVYWVGGLLQANIMEFVSQLPVFKQKLSEYVAIELAPYGVTVDQGKEILDSFVGSVNGKKMEPLGSFLQAAGGSFFQFIGNLVWVVLFLIFMLAERDGMEKRLHNAFGHRRAGKIIKVGGRISQSIEEYLGLKTLISLLAGVLTGVGLWLFGVQFALLWGVLAFLLNFIPNVGALLATVPPVIMALFQSGSPGFALLVASVLVVIHFVVGNYLEPKIMGRGLNLSPLVILFALIFWGWMWGGVGMLLAVPLTAAFNIAMEEYDPAMPLAKMISAE